MCITFWVEMEKHREISTYFCLKDHCGKEVRHFFRTVYPSKNHVTTHPVFMSLNFVLIFANSADPDEMLPSAAFHLGLPCLLKNLFTGIQNE